MTTSFAIVQPAYGSTLNAGDVPTLTLDITGDVTGIFAVGLAVPVAPDTLDGTNIYLDGLGFNAEWPGTITPIAGGYRFTTTATMPWTGGPGNLEPLTDGVVGVSVIATTSGPNVAFGTYFSGSPYAPVDHPNGGWKFSVTSSDPDPDPDPDPGPTPDPEPSAIVAARVIDSRRVRVWLPGEPAHRSPLAEGDAFDREAWQIDAAVVEFIDRVFADPLDGHPGAWAVDLIVDRPLRASVSYSVASTVLYPGGGAVLAAPGDAISVRGIAPERARLPARPANHELGQDLRYDVVAGRWLITPTGDIDAHAGVEAIEKRIIRRAITAPGGFAHLPRYGLGLREKKLLRASQRATLRARTFEQVRSETDVRAAGVVVTVRPGLVSLRISATSVAGDQLELGLATNGDGTVVHDG
jgi:hypothetical protein